MEIMLDCLPGFATLTTSGQYNIILGTTYSVTAATSVLATLAIAYRIYSFTSHSMEKRSNYSYIIEIMVQSVSVYTVLILGQAVCLFLSFASNGEETMASLVSFYVSAFGTIASVSPTEDLLLFCQVIYRYLYDTSGGCTYFDGSSLEAGAERAYSNL